MKNSPFLSAHLEVHSHYTLLGATASVESLVQRAAEDGMPALALTDSNALYGVVQFVDKCSEYGIKPLIGMALDMALPRGAMSIGGRATGRLVLLAKDPPGYRSLCRLAAQVGRQEGGAGHEQQGLPWAQLGENTEGLICVTGGRGGWLHRLLQANREREAARVASQLGGLFGQNLFLALDPAAVVDTALPTLGRRFGIPPVAVQPIFCLNEDERSRLRLLAAINANCQIQDVSVSTLPINGDPRIPVHWPKRQRLSDQYATLPEALENVAAIVEACGPALPDGRPIWPAIDLPEGQSADDALAVLSAEGLQSRFGPEDHQIAWERLQRELSAIKRSGFAPLFIIVADIVRFARQHDIPVSTRGSVANSLVAYCAGITNVDPIAFDLLFERFLNPSRAGLPDIDLDLCSRRRDEVLEYVRRKYGSEHVALVATVSTLQAKSAVRETAKAYGLSHEEISFLATLAPRRWHPDPQRRASFDEEAILSQLQSERQREVMRQALSLIGSPHHLSVHPGGVVITPGSMTDVAPVQMAPKGFLITQFDHRDMERLGLPKLDLLGIRALTVMADTVDLVRQRHDPGFGLDKISLDDSPTGSMIALGDTVGVFQCESSGARRTLRQLRATNINDMAIANAFFKPGPATGGMALSFVRRYRGDEEVRFLHPSLRPILAQTKGVLLFQEQVLRIARQIAGLSWAQADRLRKGMSKFRADEMQALEQQFLLGCQRPAPQGPAFSARQAKTLWEQVLAFAGYGFNQGHATAYADVSYRSAYLRRHFPAEFFAARLANHGGFHHPAIYIAEARRLGIAVYPPHVNHSLMAFTIDDGEVGLGSGERPSLWMGLRQVRDLRKRTARRIIDARAKRPFNSLSDLLVRVPMQEKEIRHLIQCGALDQLGPHRTALISEATSLTRAGSPAQLTFEFANAVVPGKETGAQRSQWEKHILGFPTSVEAWPTPTLPPGAVSLAQLPSHMNQPVITVGWPLPGWTGGKGFYFTDGHCYVTAVPSKGLPLRSGRKTWHLMQLKGQWRVDEWGGGWLQVTGFNDL